MRVHLIRKETVEDYAAGQARGRASFEIWLNNLEFADWNSPDDIKRTFPSADLLGRGTDRVIFNIGGNAYRMICWFKFGKRNVHLLIKWIGTHAEYNRLCELNQQYTVRAF